MTCPSDAELARFIEGTLADHTSQSIEKHLDACSHCRQTVSASARTTSANASGVHIGRYILQAPLGAGAMGVVHAAFDPDLDRRIAIKLLAPGDGAVTSRQARLAREARSLAKISHPNVVPVHDVGVSEGRLFIAMELVDGDTLRAHVANHAELAPAARLELLDQAGRGLAAAHAAGVVHRDFKPDNVFVGRDGRVRVGDFGLAAAGLDDNRGFAGDARVTHSGALLGTPAYMAPEQLRGEPATPASDQFAFAVTAWEILFGARPFSGATPEALAAAIASPPADPPSDHRALATVLRRALAAEPAARFVDLAALLAALGRAIQPRGRRGRAVVVAAIGIGLVGGAGLAYARFAHSDDPCNHAADELEAIWNPPARAALTLGFVRTGAPAGGELAADAARSIDRVAVRWSSVAVAVCRGNAATPATAPSAPTLASAATECLHARANELAALLGVFDRADLPTIEHAASAIAALGNVEACRTATAIASEVPPAQRAAVDHARTQLATALAERRTAHYREAVKLLAAIPADLPDAALRARIETNLGVIEEHLGDLAAARDHLSRAVARADDARDDHLRAEALIETLALVGDRAVALDEAARIEDQARAAVARAADPALGVALAAAIGDVELQRGKFEEATRSYAIAIAGRRAARPPDPIALASALDSAAGAREGVGDDAGALTLLDEARATAIAAVGPDHPLVAAISASMVGALEHSGRHTEAIAAAERAIAIYEHVFGPRHIQLAQAIENLAILRTIERNYPVALALFERSRAISVAVLGAEHALIGVSWLNIASTHKAAGHLDDAAAAYARAIAISEHALGPSHIDLARPLVGLADVELQRKAPDRAVPLLERALAIREATAGNPDHLAHTRWLLAQALATAHRDVARAVALGRTARDYYAAHDDAEQATTIDAWLKHAR